MAEIRSQAVGEMVEEIVGQMNEAGLTVREALVVAETLLWFLFKRALDTSAPGGLQEATREALARVIVRITSRLQAWPAKVEDRT
jgi:hypothetical protein